MIKFFSSKLCSPDKVFKRLENKFIPHLKNEITPRDIIQFIIFLMQDIEKYDISGSDKKDLVISLVTDIFEKYQEKIKNSEEIKNFIKNVLPSLINILVSLDRQEIFIKLENSLSSGCGFI